MRRSRGVANDNQLAGETEPSANEYAIPNETEDTGNPGLKGAATRLWSSRHGQYIASVLFFSRCDDGINARTDQYRFTIMVQLDGCGEQCRRDDQSGRQAGLLEDFLPGASWVSGMKCASMATRLRP